MGTIYYRPHVPTKKSRIRNLLDKRLSPKQFWAAYGTIMVASCFGIHYAYQFFIG